MEENVKMIYLTSNIADQMMDDYVTEKKVSTDIEELSDISTTDDEYEFLIKKYTNEDRGIDVKHDISSLKELGFFLNEETRKRGNYEISCFIKSAALRNEITKLFGVDLQMSKTLVSMKPGDILFTISVSNLAKDCSLHEYKEDYLPAGSKLKVKKWWVKE